MCERHLPPTFILTTHLPAGTPLWGTELGDSQTQGCDSCRKALCVHAWDQIWGNMPSAVENLSLTVITIADGCLLLKIRCSVKGAEHLENLVIKTSQSVECCLSSRVTWRTAEQRPELLIKESRNAFRIIDTVCSRLQIPGETKPGVLLTNVKNIYFCVTSIKC